MTDGFQSDAHEALHWQTQRGVKKVTKEVPNGRILRFFGAGATRTEDAFTYMEAIKHLGAEAADLVTVFQPMSFGFSPQYALWKLPDAFAAERPQIRALSRRILEEENERWKRYTESDSLTRALRFD